MARRALTAKPPTNWTALGARMAQSGDFRGAKECFTNAVKAEKASPLHRLHLAMVLEALTEFGAAAEQLTEALRIDPSMEAAAQGLGSLVSRGLLPGNVRLNTIGLKAALRHDRANRDQIAEAAVYYLARVDPMLAALELGRTEGWLAAARRLCEKKTGELLKDDLFLRAISDSLIRMPVLESLLTALRRLLLLEIDPLRFEDRALVTFAVALMRQCRLNEFVWAVSSEEAQALLENRPSTEDVIKGNPSAGIRLAIHALYRPLISLLDCEISNDGLSNVRPHAVRDAVVEIMSEHRDEQSRASRMVAAGPITDATSLKVAAQYQEYPYPRWQSLGLLLDHAGWRGELETYFPPPRLAFMDRPFEVLIAGCGTGQQAIAAAACYGPNARITAIDLSLTSLAYAARMADKFSAPDIAFMQADIGEVGSNPDFKGRFKVIECVGVLHHMADPFGGWRSLLQCLAANGIMTVALYSAIARDKWTALRNDPAYPGIDCSDAQLRDYRQLLFAKPDEEVGPHLKGVLDMYTTSGFRDLILHPEEHRHSIPEFADFMDKTGLRFRGFYGGRQLFASFKAKYPDEQPPGSLKHWAEFEAANPAAFGEMYRFWCDRS